MSFKSSALCEPVDNLPEHVELLPERGERVGSTNGQDELLAASADQERERTHAHTLRALGRTRADKISRSKGRRPVPRRHVAMVFLFSAVFMPAVAQAATIHEPADGVHVAVGSSLRFDWRWEDEEWSSRLMVSSDPNSLVPGASNPTTRQLLSSNVTLTVTNDHALVYSDGFGELRSLGTFTGVVYWRLCHYRVYHEDDVCYFDSNGQRAFVIDEPPPPPPAPPPEPTPQPKPPVIALPSVGNAGQQFRLRFRFSGEDGFEPAYERISIFRGTRLVRRFSSDDRDVEVGASPQNVLVLWYVSPEGLRRGSYRWCILPFTETGQSGKPSCNRLRIRPRR